MTPEQKDQVRMEKERLKAEKQQVKEAAAFAKEMEREAKRAEKERKKEEKKNAPPKKRGRPPKQPAELSEAPSVPDMPTYGKLDLLRGFAEEVYTSLGAGHLESIYHAAMAVELRLAGLMYESEQVMPVTHKGNFVGVVRADIVVNKECILEFKISGKLDDAKQQARQYMKLQGIQHGFVVMFPKTDGGKVQFVDARLPDDAE
jgi:GxxExxY protein